MGLLFNSILMLLIVAVLPIMLAFQGWYLYDKLGIFSGAISTIIFVFVPVKSILFYPITIIVLLAEIALLGIPLLIRNKRFMSIFDFNNENVVENEKAA